ncbi:hypothetical protein QBC43DRAFT_36933 [Cladorrhinum sp. PSN259]|nr:hypothetical protein QBC43DRAFT_36933 [Cladorrhinum sp. PSN259]
MLAGAGLSDKDCVQYLKAIFGANQTTRYTVMVDALDECRDYDALLELLQQAVGRNKNVRIAFTSRLQVRVKDAFPDVKTVTIESQNLDDIKRFLEIEIPKRRVGCGMTDAQEAKLRKLLLERASGMFMWVKLQLGLFLHEVKSKRIRLEEDIQRKLDSMEASETIGEDLLYSAYDEVYNTATGDTSQPRRKEIAVMALRWVLCAFRALTLRELAYAVSVRLDGSVAPGVQEGLILEFCSNLLMEDTAGVVRFPHLSVRHYLEDRIPTEFDQRLAHLQAALTCLYFANSLQFDTFGHSRSGVLQQGNVTLTKTFHAYVSTYWPRHCQETQKTEDLDRLIESFTAKSTKLRRARTFSEQDEHKLERKREPKETLEAKRSAAWFEIFQSLLDSSSEDVALYIARGLDLAVKDPHGSSLLHEACRLRELQIAKMLIDAGAPLDAKNYLGNTPLHIASLLGVADIARALLVAGADKNARNLRGETPLHAAVCLGADEVVEALLAANADALAKDHRGMTGLHFAVALEKALILESLLLMGYNANAKDENGDTALSLAIKLGKGALVEMLLRHGAVLDDDTKTLVASSASPEVYRLVSQFDPVNTKPLRFGDPKHKKDYLYSVDLGAGVSPCRYCNVVRWVTESRRGTSYSYHPSLQGLRASAIAGCPLCTFFLRELNREENQDDASYSQGKLLVTIDPSSTQGSKMDRKDKLVLSLGGTPVLTYELCVDSTGRPLPALDWLTGIAIKEFPDIKTISGWIKTCEDDHGECLSGDGDALPLLPTRVLDVGALRLVQSEPGQTGKYLYLSFAWGGVPLYSVSLMSRSGEEVEFEKLAPLLQDAITMTRRLGLQYLWIDALCILQDSRVDMTREIRQMPQYQQRASFVIVAATGSAGEGSSLFQARQKPLVRMDIAQLDGSTTNRTAIYLRHLLETAAEALGKNALRRAWMVQEVVLPRRLLIIGEDQLYWHCRTSLRSEGNALVQKPFLKLLPRMASAEYIQGGAGRSFFPWYELAHIYSRSETTVKSDRLPALFAMAQYFDNASTYACGLWVEDVQNGLLWYAVEVQRSDNTESYVGPSWSWVSRCRGVSYYLLEGCQHGRVPASMAFSVLGVQFSPNHPAIFMPEKPAHLEIEAMTLEATAVGYDPGKCFFFFDDVVVEQAWRVSSLGSFLLVLVCPWGVGMEVDFQRARGLGLVLRNVGFDPQTGEDGSLPCYTRAGLFLMDSYGEETSKWTRRQLKIL